MEAARVATLRGHRVTLCEQKPRLGGAMLLSSITNPRIGPVLKYMTREVKKSVPDIRLNTQVTPALVDALSPDVLVVAQGGKSAPMNVIGMDNEIVLSRSDAESILGGRAAGSGSILHRIMSFGAAMFVRFFYNPRLLRKLMRFPFPFKKRVSILGGGFAGVELAETLAESGKKVSIVEPGKRMGSDIDIIHRWVFLKNLKEAGAELLTSTKVLEVEDAGVKVERDGAQRTIGADTVVPINITSNSDLAEQYKDRIPEVYVVGDCREPAKLQEAVTSGFLAGQKI